jgi:transposase-like protein
MAKHMCKLIKEEFHLKKTGKFKKLVEKPHFVCKKCGRVSNKDTYVCKPVELD